MKDFPDLVDDGLIAPEIGSWGEKKYHLVAFYASLFVRAMRNRWDCLVYIDLFSGSGRSKIRGTNRIVPASPLAALNLEEKFDCYIFCERNENKYKVLKQRINRDYQVKNVHIIQGDANQLIEDIFNKMPQFRKDYKVLAFCFVDPYAMNMKFKSIEKLSKRFMDFLILIPSGMDANRFVSQYENPDNHTIDDFLGNSTWRDTWKDAKNTRTSFEAFIVNEFGKSMESLNYIDPGLNNTKLIRSDEKNLPLYRLALYSRHKLGIQFWQQAEKYTEPQLKLDF